MESERERKKERDKKKENKILEGEHIVWNETK